MGDDPYKRKGGGGGTKKGGTKKGGTKKGGTKPSRSKKTVKGTRKKGK
jgi:hypothetical protein